ncbi:MAG: threonylcarbamoyl-AMP synthase [Flavobacterium sp.]|nr:threonylcarbamoyl-AMP synthase [Pedobacter sp.]
MLKEEIEKAIVVLQNGGIILYPTDTIWGIGCDACDPVAVDKIYKLKGRDENKSMIILLDSENKLSSYARDVPDIAYDLIEFAENPLTIIYSGAKNLASNLIAKDGTIGIRITKDDFSKQLIQRFKKPLVSTSANISNQPSPANFNEINKEIIQGVDLVVNWKQDDLSKNKSSAIMKLETDGRFEFLRR